MYRLVEKFIGAAFLCAVLVSLAACGNVSRDVAKDGHGAGQLVWPAPKSATPMHRGGTFPDVDTLRALHAGLNKQQVANLIGYPHFSEGVFAVREWNYLFNFRHPGSTQVTVCQYKVLFDADKLAQSFYWKPETCAQLLQAVATAPAKEQVFTLSTDALFAFDKYSVADITNDGKAQLNELAHKLIVAGDGVRNVHITGYTDRLGSASYNDDLSEHRAYAVMHYLVDHGVPEASITAEGLGMTNPVKDCPDGLQTELITCLAPNRRVVVKVDIVGNDRAEVKSGM